MSNVEGKNFCEKKHDFNQNLIEPPKSYEKLCNMINQLEKDSSIEIAEHNRIDLLATDIKHDVNLEPALCKYLERVSKSFTCHNLLIFQIKIVFHIFHIYILYNYIILLLYATI